MKRKELTAVASNTKAEILGLQFQASTKSSVPVDAKCMR
jgi:hypothetical protein